MILLTRAASECEVPLSLGHWHDMVARYFALGIVLRRATVNTDRDGDENLRMQGGRTLVPEIIHGSKVGTTTKDNWANQRQLAIIRREKRRGSRGSYGPYEAKFWHDTSKLEEKTMSRTMSKKKKRENRRLKKYK